MQEVFIKFTFSGIASATTATFSSVEQVAQGTTHATRIGDNIQARSIYLRWEYTHSDDQVTPLNNGEDQGRIVLLWDKAHGNADWGGLSPDDIYDDTGGTVAFLKRDSRYRYWTMLSIPITFKACKYDGITGGLDSYECGERYLQFQKPIQFNYNASTGPAGGTSSVKNSLGINFWCNTNKPNIVGVIWVQFKYTDV